MFATIQKLYTTNYTDQSDFDGQDSGHTFLGDVRSRILSRAGVNASPLGPGGFCWSFPSSILASKTHQVDFGMDSRHSHISALFSLLQSSQSFLSPPPPRFLLLFVCPHVGSGSPFALASCST